VTARKHPDLKLLHGNPGNRPVSAEKGPTAERLSAATDLTDSHEGATEAVTSHFKRPGLVEALDHAVLVVWCSVCGVDHPELRLVGHSLTDSYVEFLPASGPD